MVPTEQYNIILLPNPVGRRAKDVFHQKKKSLQCHSLLFFEQKISRSPLLKREAVLVTHRCIWLWVCQPEVKEIFRLITQAKILIPTSLWKYSITSKTFYILKVNKHSLCRKKVGVNIFLSHLKGLLVLLFLFYILHPFNETSKHHKLNIVLVQAEH